MEGFVALLGKIVVTATAWPGYHGYLLIRWLEIITWHMTLLPIYRLQLCCIYM